MNGVARIMFSDGALVMPARSRYDRELVFEQAEFYARRHGQVRLELGRRQLVIRPQAGTPCSQCGSPDGLLVYSAGDALLCRYCARRLCG